MIRFWSDIGVVPPAGRTVSGLRQHDTRSLARVELVSSSHELAQELAEVRKLAE